MSRSEEIMADYLRRRERRQLARHRRNQVLMLMGAALLVVGNALLFVYYEDVSDWLRSRFGEYTIVVERPGS